MSYTSIYNQAERLRHALRSNKATKKYLEGHFGQPVEDCLEFINDDLDNIERKITAALIPLDELLNEIDPDEEEDESGDRYVLVGRG